MAAPETAPAAAAAATAASTDLRHRLEEFSRDGLTDLGGGKEEAGHGLVLDGGHAVLGREGLDALRKPIFALGEDDRGLIDAALVF